MCAREGCWEVLVVPGDPARYEPRRLGDRLVNIASKGLFRPDQMSHRHDSSHARARELTQVKHQARLMLRGRYRLEGNTPLSQIA